MELLEVQYAFHPTGSTCCALVDFIHQFTLMLKMTHIFGVYLLTFQKHLM